MNEEQIMAVQNFEAVASSVAFAQRSRFEAACMAMQGILAFNAAIDPADSARDALMHADALLAALSPATSEGGK